MAAASDDQIQVVIHIISGLLVHCVCCVVYSFIGLRISVFFFQSIPSEL